MGQIRHIALDLDGTIYRGGTLFATTLPFLKSLKDCGIGYTFLTNNSSRSDTDYLTHLQRLGITATPNELCTSTQATLRYLVEKWPRVRRIFLLGTTSLAAEFAAAGFKLTRDDPDDEPEAVVVGFDTSLVFERLCRAAYWIGKGKPFIATHPDRVCPSDQPTILVDCGSICAALEKATGCQPDAVLGKPDPIMLHEILRRHNLAPQQLAMVGDRLYTDMAMAQKTGALSILVLTGETTAASLTTSPIRPDVVVQDLDQLGELLKKAS